MLKQTPRAVTVPPPSFMTLPPVVAEVPVILVGKVVLTFARITLVVKLL